MTIPKPKKLPSGNWRIQIMVNGKRYSITNKDPKVCKQKAKELYAGLDIEINITPLTVGDAIDRYIETQTGTLSPSTIGVYKRYKKSYLQTLMPCHLKDLSSDLVQAAISYDSKHKKSPKTIRNAYGLLTATLKMFRPKFKPEIKLPQKTKYELEIPTEAEMKKIWTGSKGSKYELPILLASWLGLRMSEIRGLRFEDLNGNQLHICRAIVRTGSGDAVKGTKSFSGDRYITCPQKLVDAITARPNTNGYICPYSESAIYNYFSRLCEREGIRHYRFHDLRHFAASEAHSLGVPDKYQMKRMGHKTDDMLRKVYQHTIRDKEDHFAELIDTQMASLFQ